MRGRGFSGRERYDIDLVWYFGNRVGPENGRLTPINPGGGTHSKERPYTQAG